MSSQQPTIGFLVDDLLSRYQTRLYSGLRTAARHHGFRVIGFSGGYLTSDSRPGRNPSSFLYDLATPHRLDGLVVVSSILATDVGSEPVRAYCEQRGLPLVSIGKLAGFPWVDADNELGITLLMEHLVSVHGFERLAFIQGSVGNPHSEVRESCFRRVLAENDLAVREDCILPGDFLESSGERAIHCLLDERHVPVADVDAIVAANDHMALGALRELNRRGIVVPRDLAIAGFDDEDVARIASPALTTVAQPVEAIGARAGELILELLARGRVAEENLVPTPLMIRRSCGCAGHPRARRAAPHVSEAPEAALESAREASRTLLGRFVRDDLGIPVIDAAIDMILCEFPDDEWPLLERFETAVLEMAQHGLEPTRWLDILAPLCDKVTGRRRAAKGWSSPEYGASRVIGSVNAVARRVEGLERLLTAQQATALRILGSSLVCARSVGAFRPILESTLPGLGVGFCCVCLFDAESRHLQHFAKAIVSYAPGDFEQTTPLHRTEELWQMLPGSVPPAGFPGSVPPVRFPVADLLPDEVMLGDLTRNLFVYPLAFGKEPLGYVVFDEPARSSRAWILDGIAGHLSAAIASLQNADRLRQAIRGAEAASAAKSEFVSVMSHEIRTPMTAIMGHIDLCLRAELGTEQRRHLTLAQTSTRLLIDIVNDLLDFSKIEAQRLELENVPFMLDDVLDHVSGACALAAWSKGLELVFDIEPGVPDALVGDPLRLGQVLVNLVNNATKFSSEGTVLLSVTRAGVDLSCQVALGFAVEDRGIGMTEEQVERVFQPFAQADGSTTRRFGGTGLGLTITQRIVRLMGGELEVRSKIGEGSTFSFAVTLGVGEAPEEASVDAQGVRVLLVEDCSKQREALKRQLEAHRFEVTSFADAGATVGCLEALSSNLPFHLVLVDESLPGVDSVLLVRELARFAPLIRGPVVLMRSPNSAGAVTGQLFHDGVATTIVKPPNRATIRSLGRNAGRMRSSSRPPAAGETAREASLRGRSALLVQDDPVSREVLAEMLGLTGLSVAVACDGAEALRVALARTYDVVLLDIGLPIMDGCAVARALRMDSRYIGVPIIALTARTDVESRQRCLAAGMNDCVTTPVEAERLSNIIAVSLRDPQPALVLGLRRSASSAAFTAIRPAPELEANAAIARLGGNRALYERLLKRFTEAHRRSADLVRRAVAEGDHEAAETVVHCLVSAAGNVGAAQLAHAAQNLEIALRRKVLGGMGQLVADLEFVAASTLTAVERYLGSVEQPEAASEAGHERLDELLVTLEELLDSHDTVAVERVEDLRTAAAGHCPEEVLSQLVTSTRDYDFERAAATLRELRGKLGALRDAART